MELSVLTPTRLWQDFDPCQDPLMYSVTGRHTEGGLTFTDIYFTALTAEDGPVRAYVSLVRKQGTEKLPALLYIPDYGKLPKKAFMTNFAERGYAVFAINYCGMQDAEHNSTKYPQSLSYGLFENSYQNLYSCTEGAQKTPLFLWTKVARRAVTLALQFPGVLSPNLFLVGNKQGANIAWQAAGTDTRIKALAPIINAGWQEYEGISKFSEEALEFTSEREAWLTGCSVASYAKNVSCPVFFAGASNSDITPVERIQSTLSLVKEAPVSLSISPRTTRQIESDALETMDRFFKGYVTRPVYAAKPPSGQEKKAAALPKNPSLKLELGDTEITAEITCDSKKFRVNHITLSFASADFNPSYRNWESITVLPEENGSVSVDIPFGYEDVTLLAFASVYYKEGFMLSTTVSEGTPKASSLKKLRKSHIIYETRMGTGGFVADAENTFYLDRDSVRQEAGPLDINGITVKRGDLSSYALSDPKYAGKDGSLLQFDAASSDDRTATLTLFAEQEDHSIVRYFLNYEIKAGDWHKFIFNAGDFKTDDQIPLKNWSAIKKISFKDASGMLFNNLLWV